MSRLLRSPVVALLAIVVLLLNLQPPVWARGQAPLAEPPGAPAQTGMRVYLPLLATPSGEDERIPIALGDTVSDGVPRPGAGNLESPGASDSYSFVVEPDRQIMLDVLGEEPELASTRWRLLTPGGSVVFDRNLDDTGVVSLAGPGQYTLVVGGVTGGGTGTYSFRLIGLPLPDRFALAVGDTVAAGVPGAGAGTIEESFTKDIYTFTAAAAQRVVFDLQSVDETLSGVSWQLLAPSGSIVFDRILGADGGADPGVYTLSAGVYTIVVGDNVDPDVGTYGFQLRAAPAPQQFAIALGDAVSNGGPAAGAGNIEQAYGQDVYTFAGEAGQRVIFAVLDDADAPDQMSWVLTAPDGATLFNRSFSDSQFGQPDVYTLPVTGAYSLTIGAATSPSTGTYGFQLRAAPAPQQFSIAVGDTVEDGAPAEGAGNIEQAYGQDLYTFAGAAGQRVIFDVLDVAGSLDGVGWRLDAPGGRVIFNRELDTAFSNPSVYILPATGAYTITVGDLSESNTGTYSFQLRAAPAPQQFSIAIGDTVEDGAPAEGAGNIEQAYGQDLYTFAGAAGQRVIFEMQSAALTLDGVDWRLVGPGGRVIFDRSVDVEEPFEPSVSIATLPTAGAYTLIVGDDFAQVAGTYSFELRAAPAAQQFSIAVGDTVEEGAPGDGAGRIDEVFGQDAYSFSGTAGQRVIFDVLAVGGALDQVSWRLVGPTGNTIFDRDLDPVASNPRVYTLRVDGAHTILVSANSASSTGTYRFQLRSPPTPEQFAISLGEAVSNGVPAAGAGNIEGPFAQDVYTFAGVAGQRVFIALPDAEETVENVQWRLLMPDGSVLLDRSLRQRLSLRTLPSNGTYTIVVGDDLNEGTGTYQLRLGLVPAPQQFVIAIGDTVANGAPGAGAGNLEAPGARDVYTFTAAAGQRVVFQLVDADGELNEARWSLTGPGGKLLNSGFLSLPELELEVLTAPGTYTIVVENPNGPETGAYSFQLRAAPAPERFAIAVGDTVEANVPGPGAGSIEDPFGQDIYTFSAQEGQEVFFDLLTVSEALENVNLRLLGPDGSEIFEQSLRFDPGLRTMPATGTYTLIVGDDLDPGTGSYRFEIR